MSELFPEAEDASEGVQLTVNEHYARAFEFRKEREELEKLKAKYGSDYDPNDSEPDLSTDSESAESEDEDGEELTPAVDVAILRTLARIKKKDPGIYDSSKNIFGEEQEKISSVPTINGGSTVKDRVKPVTLRQAKLDSVLRGSRSPSPSAEVDQLTHVQEQEQLRKETIAAFHNAVTDGDDFLIPRSKTKDELEREEEEYRAFLEREVGDLNELVTVDATPEVLQIGDEVLAARPNERIPGESKKKKKKKVTEKDKGKKTKSEEDQEFLMNYILNRGWIDHSERHVPTYNEITVGSSSKDKQKMKKRPEPDADVEEEDGNLDLDALSEASFDSLASHFEASYNHRFEEPDAAIISAYPRNIASTVRRADTVRKDARERKKQRKEEDIEKKKEEVRRLKALKMREVRRKLELIGREAGLKGSKRKGKATAEDEGEDGGVVDEALKDLDLEGDWDPAKHDLQMAGLFERDEEFFEPQYDDEDDEADEEGLQYDEDGKPVWDDDIALGDIPISDDDTFGVGEKAHQRERKKELKKLKKQQEQHQDDEGVDIDAMDADAPMAEGFEDEEWDGTEEMRKRVLDKYMDEIYGLEFNDMVGDLPTRFKYMPTEPTTYSLTPAEILMASDKELNEYMSVKKYAPYRLDKQDKHRYSKKNQDKLRELKGKLVERGGRVGFGRRDDALAGGEGEVKQKKRKGKKERMKLKATSGDQEVDSEQPLQDLAGDDTILANESTKTLSDDKRPKKRKRDASDDTGIPPPRSSGVIGQQVEATSRGGAESDDGSKKRKRRHRKKDGVIGNVLVE